MLRAAPRLNAQFDFAACKQRLPEVWNALEFGLTWRGQKLRVTADKQRVAIANTGDQDVTVTLAGKATVIAAGQSVSAEI